MANFFDMFNHSKFGPGVPEHSQDAIFVVYFKVLARKLTKVVQVSMMYSIAVLPVTLLFLLYAPLYTETNVTDQAILQLYFFEIATLMFLAVVGLPICAPGFSYIMRNFAREEHAFVLSDFVEHIKANWKKMLILTLIDIAAVYLLVTGFKFYSVMQDELPISEVCKWLVVAFGGVIFMMHFYIYQLTVTFDISLPQILRNSLMLTLAKLPFNIIILAVCILFSAAVFSMDTLLGIAISFIFGIGFLGYTVNFYVNNVIYKLMIKPKLSADASQNQTD